jgi:hypothetical protein
MSFWACLEFQENTVFPKKEKKKEKGLKKTIED